MNYSLSKRLEDYVSEQVKSGSFNNASEVVRDALRLHEEYQLKLEALRHDVKRGVSSIRAGRISRAAPEEIMKKAKTRRG